MKKNWNKDRGGTLLGVDAKSRLSGSMAISLASNLSREQRPSQSVG